MATQQPKIYFKIILIVYFIYYRWDHIFSRHWFICS